MELLRTFQTLVRPSAVAGICTFTVARVHSSSPHLIGKDADGAPAFLVSVSESRGASPGPLVLLHVAVSHRVRCRLESPDGVAETSLTIVRCVSPEPALREYFVRIVGLTAEELGPCPEPQRVEAAIRLLIELFRSFELPARRTVQGLWAELAVVSFARDPSRVVASWHAEPEEGFDFSDGPRRVEVKSSSIDARVHVFSLQQARPPAGATVVIASLKAVRAAGGASIADLLRQLEHRLTAAEIQRVAGIVAACLGDTAPVGLGLGFDIALARASLQFYPSSRVPAIEPPLPAGVLSVRFEALLAEADAMTGAELCESGDFFAAFAPVC